MIHVGKAEYARKEQAYSYNWNGIFHVIAIIPLEGVQGQCPSYQHYNALLIATLRPLVWRNQGHATFRTHARFVLNDLQMHRA